MIRRSIFCLFFLAIFSCSPDSNFDPPEQGETEEPIDEEPDNSEEEGLAMFNINTGGREIIDDPKINATLLIEKGSKSLFSGPIGIELRGASSLWFDKKQYGFETWDDSGNDLDVSLLDYPEEEDWILNGPYVDKSLMRNKFVYDLSNSMGRYASRAEFVEMKLNGIHKGVYVFLEKIKRDQGRVDISKLKDIDISGEELTGGYIMKIDKGHNGGMNYDSNMSFESNYSPLHDDSGLPIRFQYVYPKPDEIQNEQRIYIQEYIDSFESSLASNNFQDPNQGYRAYADVDSFIDFFILNELGNNVDGFRLSTYFHKPKNGKLIMGPIWDFNFAFGNADYCSGGETNVWAYRFNERCGGDGWSIPFWWERLMQDPYFVEKLKSRWNLLRGGILANNSLETQIEEYYTTLSANNAINRNFTIWDILDIYLWPNNYVGGSYNNEFNYFKTWVVDRANWMDNAINSL